MSYSLIIPLLNEEKNVTLLNEKLLKVLQSSENKNRTFEIIYVDDGSTDKTFEQLKKLNGNLFKTLIIRHRINLSQSTALYSGIQNSQYENLIFLDGDLQDNVEELDKLLNEFEKEDCDMVIGYRKNRKDNFLTKTIPSLIANFLVRLFTKSKIKDHGCAFKVVKKYAIDEYDNWGDFHRLLAARLANYGFIVREVEVKHNKRLFGKSKYGFERILKVVIDLIYLNFFQNFERRSIYLFGKLGISSLVLAFAVFAWMLVLKFYYSVSFISTPLPILIIFFLIAGLIFLFMGTLAHLLIVQKEKLKQNSKKTFADRILFDK